MTETFSLDEAYGHRASDDATTFSLDEAYGRAAKPEGAPEAFSLDEAYGRKSTEGPIAPPQPADRPAPDPAEAAQQGDENEAIRQAMARGDKPAGLPPEPAANGAPEQPSYLGNIARGIGERAAHLAGSGARFIGQSADQLADWLEQKVPLGQVSIGSDGIQWRPSTQQDLDRESPLLPAARSLEGTKFGYQPRTTWEDVKRAPLSSVLPFALEQGLVSAPDMAAVMLNLPAYVAARTGEIGQERAQNDQRQEATVGDFLAAAPAAVGSALLERLGTHGILGLDDAVRTFKGLPGAVGKAALKEAGTEAGQEAIEYTGETLGTDKGWNAAEMGERALAGAVAGGPFGGGVRAATGTAQIAARPPVDIAPPNVTPADIASPIPTDLISSGRSIVDELLTPKPAVAESVADLPQGAVPAEVLLGQVAEPAATEAPIPQTTPVEPAPIQPMADAGAPAGLQPLYDDETDQQIGWFDPETGRARPMEASAPEARAQEPAPPELPPSPLQAAETATLRQNNGTVIDAPSPQEAQPQSAPSAAAPALDFSAQAEPVLPEPVAPAAPEQMSGALRWNLRNSEVFNAQIMDNDDHPIGVISGRFQPRGIQVRTTEMEDAAKGKGFGARAYAELADIAHQQGGVLMSDGEVTEAAVRVYEALGRRGYVVARNPSAVWIEDRGERKLVTKHRSIPVFQVEPRSAPSAQPAQPARDVDAPPILTKSGAPFASEKGAALAARQRPDLKGQALEPVRVDGGWGLRLVDQPAAPAPNFVQSEAQAQQALQGAMDEIAPPMPGIVQPVATPRDLGPPLPARQTRINDAARTPGVLEASMRRADETRNRPRQTPEQRKASEAAKAETLGKFDEAAASGVADWKARSNAERNSRSGAVRPKEWERGYFSTQEMEYRAGWNDALAGQPSIDPEFPAAYRKGVLEARAWVEQNPRPEGGETIDITARTSRGQETRYSLPADADAIRAVRGNVEKLPVDRFSVERDAGFVRAPDGSPNFGEIGVDAAAIIGRQPGAIRLREGDAASGLTHIRDRHTEDARQRGYDSVEAMIADVARNYDEIHKGAGRTLILVKRDGHQSGAAWIQLEPSPNGDFYDVKTATPSRDTFMKNNAPAWKRSAQRDATDSNGGVATSPAPFSARAQAGEQNVGDPTPDANRPNGEDDALRLAPEFERALPAIEADLRARLQRYGIADRVGLRLVDAIRHRETGEPIPNAAGRYGRRVIEVALDASSRTFTLDHEAIHALRDLDLIRPLEWRALQREVLADNERMADVRARYPQFARTDTRAEMTDRIIEEAVADLFGRWQAGQVEAKGFVRTAMERIRDFLRAVGQSLRGEGFRTVDSVFRAIDRGEIGRRGVEAEAGVLAEAHHAQLQPRGEDGRFLSSDRLSVEGPVGDKTPGASLFGRPQESVGDILRHSTAPLISRIREASSAKAVGESVDRWRANLQDRYLPLLRAQQAIERVTGAPLDEVSNPYLGEELSAGRIGAQLEDLTETMVRPLFQDMHRRGVTVEELEAFLYARHAPERNARIAEINPKFGPGQGSGMTDGEAEAIMKAVARSGKKDDLAALAARVDAVLKFALDTREKAGLLSAEEAKAWRANYKHYVPLRGNAELDADTNTDRPRKPRGVSITGAESQRAFGRESRAADILAYTVMQAEEAIIRAETNHVARQFYDLAKANPAPGFWMADKVAMRRYWNKAKQQVEHRAESRVLAEDKDFTVTAKIDGAEHRVVLDRTNPDAARLAESMRNLKGEKIGAVLRTFGAVNRYLSMVNTSLNPEFVITNAFRDLQTAAINLNQHDIEGIVSGTLKDYPAALKASMKGAFKSGEGSWGKWYDEFRAEGGRVYFNSQDDITAQRAKIARELADAQPGLTAMKAIRGVFGWIEKVNLGVENAVRLAAYKNAREGGLSQARAASLAKNLTVNFNRRGHYGPLINSAYLFYNASIQGTAVLLGAMKHRKVQYALGAAVLTGAMMEMLNMALTGADDDGEDYYSKISEFEKSRNLIVMDPWGEKGSYFKIPLPYGYNAFYHLGRSAVELSNGKDAGKTMGSLLTTIIDSFNPVGGTESLLNLIAPTVIDPIVDLSRNRDYTSKPIKPEQPQYGAKKPESQMFWGSVSPVSKAITDFMNEATGGDKVRAGKIDVSPEALDYLFGVATGAAGTFYGRVGNALLKLADPGAELTPNDIPVYRKMVGEKPRWYDRTMFYERAKAVEQLWSERQAYAKAGEHQKAREVGAEIRGLPGLKDLAHETRQELSEISKERTAALLSHEAGRISDGGFRLKTKAMEIREKGLLDRFNKRYRASLEPRE